MRSARIVLEHSPELRDRSGQNVIANKRVRPDCVYELFFGKDGIRLGRQLNQNLHHLGFEVNRASSPTDAIELRLNLPLGNVKGSFQDQPSLASLLFPSL